MDVGFMKQVFGDRYQGYQIIGSGSYSRVYRATTQNDELVAIKVVNIKNMQKEIIPYMLNEIELLTQSNNTNIIKLIESQRTEQNLFLVLEFCYMDVDFMARRYFQSKVPENIVINIFRQIVNGLSYLHKNDIIHRDIKLENFAILMSPEDINKLQNNNDLTVLSTATYKLIDLGLAKRLQSATTSTWAGTELNMAPEILQEFQYSFQADMYSLGVCLYQLITGKYPYWDPTNRTPQHELIKRENADYSLIQTVKLRDIIQKMLKFDPKERLQWSELYNYDFFKIEQGDLVTGLDQDLQQNIQIYESKIIEIQELNQNNSHNNPQQQQQQQQQKQQQQQQQQQHQQQQQQQQQQQYQQQQQQQQQQQYQPSQYQTPQFNQNQQTQKNTNLRELPQQAQNLQLKKDQQLYDPKKQEKEQTQMLYNIRNQYAMIFKTVKYLNELSEQAQKSNYNYMTMKSQFNMFTTYLNTVGKQLFNRLLSKVKFYEPTLSNWDQFKNLQRLVIAEDQVNFQNISCETSQQGMFSGIKKLILKQIDCEQIDSMQFKSQYENINIEIYRHLLRLLQDMFYKQKSLAENQQDKALKCKIYLCMYCTIKLRVLFIVQMKEIDTKEQDLFIKEASNEPDQLSERVTKLLEEYNIRYE